MLDAMEDAKYGIKPKLVPYIKILENDYHKGEFGKHYLCIGFKGEKWLFEKSILMFQANGFDFNKFEILDKNVATLYLS